MKNLFSFLLSVCMMLSASAQKVYFLYLQTENGNPFYAKMGDKVYSSSALGFVTLSNLTDSTYTITVGFPSASETKFSITIKGKDRGFLIKNLNDGPGLFDLETQDIIRPLKDPSKSNLSYEKRTDAFTTLLAKAANDTTLLYVPVSLHETVLEAPVKKQEKKEADMVKTGEPKIKTEEIKQKTDDHPVHSDTTNATVKTMQETANTSSVETKQETHLPAKQEPLIQKSTDSVVSAPEVVAYKKSTVKRHSESSQSEGFGLVFFDEYEGNIDTIRLTIPNSKVAFRETDTSVRQDEKKFLEFTDKAADRTKKDTAQKTGSNAGKPPTLIRPAKPLCANRATDNDFFKLRKSMAAKNTDEEMIGDAKKYFRSKCFTTEQIRNLGSLFLTASGKYQFFDTAYAHVSDQDQFATLQLEIKDDYYSKRFKALIGE